MMTDISKHRLTLLGFQLLHSCYCESVLLSDQQLWMVRIFCAVRYRVLRSGEVTGSKKSFLLVLLINTPPFFPFNVKCVEKK